MHATGTDTPRVLFVVAGTQRRGAEVFARTLAERLAEGGLPTRIRAVQSTPGITNPEVEPLSDRRWSAGGFQRLCALARDADVVVGFGSSGLLHGAAAAKVAGRPFVYQSIGDPAFWGAVRGANLRVGAPLRSAAAVVGLYPDAVLELRRRYRLAPERTVVIPNGVDDGRFRPPSVAERQEARSRLGVPDGRAVVGYLGALSEEKRPLRAVEAVAPLEDAFLVVAGGGPLAADLRDATVALDGRCALLGPVADVPSVLAAFDVLLLPSRTEGIPGAVIEAALCGVPAVATDVGGVSAVVRDGVGGRVVPVEDLPAMTDALREVLRDHRAMGERAREHCLAEYTLEGVTDRWRELLLRVGAGVPV